MIFPACGSYNTQIVSGDTNSKYELYKAVYLDNNCYSKEETEALVNGTYDQFIEAINAYSLEERAKAKVADGTIDASLLEAAGL